MCPGWAQSGRAGLKQAGRAGRKPKLSASQLRKIEQALKRGPEALGDASGLWTTGRVRELIEDQCGVRYHEAHVWRILRQLGWSCQRPTGRALERDEAYHAAGADMLFVPSESPIADGRPGAAPPHSGSRPDGATPPRPSAAVPVPQSPAAHLLHYP